ncbi:MULTISPECIES: hypothetical protein [Priestia]|uniref:hypothetical protein n=1 Tax=Priestia TaxID=2800373 RepID=UPI00336B7A6E
MNIHLTIVWYTPVDKAAAYSSVNRLLIDSTCLSYRSASTGRFVSIRIAID